MVFLSSKAGRAEQQRSGPAVHSDPESGFVLLAVIFLTVALLITLAIAAPKISTSIQRDKEIETIHRGEQYKRAIKLYYKKFGAYPTSIDQLVDTNNIRFLRKRYLDPLTGKDDWKPVYFGQAHVHPLGFFGQPLAAAGMAGMASTAGASIISSSMYAIAPTSGDGATNGTATSGNGNSGTAATGTAGQAGATNTSFGSGSTNSSFGSGSSGFGSGSSSFGSSSPTGSGFGSTSGSTPTSPFGSSTTGSSGTSGTFGGNGPIVGFTLPVNKPSLLDYRKQTRYNHWEFNYDPMEDQMQAMSGIAGGATNVNNSISGASGMSGNSGPGTSTGGSSFGSSGSGFGNSSPSTGFGSSSPSIGFGSTGTGSTTGSGSTGSDNGSTPQSTNPQ